MGVDEVTQGRALVESMVRVAAEELGVSLEALEWGQDADDFRLGRHSLACSVNGRRTVERFSVEELSDAPAASAVRRRLGEQVSAWLEGLVPSKRIGFRPPPSS
jgi:hypothetical protein